MTPRQKQYYDAIKGFIEKNGYSPSSMDIHKMMGLKGKGRVSVNLMIWRLVDQGYIAVRGGPRGYRDIRILSQEHQTMNSCNRQHVRIWFHANFCPLCELMTKIQWAGTKQAEPST